MNWTTLKPAPRDNLGAEIRFAIRQQSNNCGVRLTLSIRPDIAKKAGIVNGDKVTMQLGKDDKTGKALCRLTDTAGPGASTYRVDGGKGRGTVEFSCSGDVRDAWTANVIGMTDLAFISVAKGEIERGRSRHRFSFRLRAGGSTNSPKNTISSQVSGGISPTASSASSISTS